VAPPASTGFDADVGCAPDDVDAAGDEAGACDEDAGAAGEEAVVGPDGGLVSDSVTAASTDRRIGGRAVAGTPPS
jgi:hypothetical protein